MKTTAEVTAFVKTFFENYSMPKSEFFEEFDDAAWEMRETELFPKGEMDSKTLSRLSTVMGMTVDEITSCDLDAAMRMYRKYPFFDLYKEFIFARSKQYYYQGNPSAKEILERSLFTDKRESVPCRYDYTSVKKRLKKTLKEIDEALPGTWHSNASITKLEITTEIIVDYPGCTQMMSSFFDIIERINNLFFDSLKRDLSQDEIMELNFLVSWFDVVDISFPRRLTYDNLQKLKALYIDEHKQFIDFISFARIRGFIYDCPWQCKQFFDDPTVPQRFVNVFPQAKTIMREYANHIENFTCSFVWSDAKPVSVSPFDDAFVDEDIQGIIDSAFPIIPEEKRHKEITTIYVKKEKQELFDWHDTINKIKKAVQSVSKGGLYVPRPDRATINYRERMVKISHCLIGGGTDE